METRKLIMGMVVAVLVSLVVLIAIPWVGATESLNLSPEDDGADALSSSVQAPDSVPETVYKADEIIVKFKKAIADKLEEQLSQGKAVDTLELSPSLDSLSLKHKVRDIKPLIKNFEAQRQRIENLLKKDKSKLNTHERHLLRRLKRAPKGAKVPDLGRIYKIELEPGQSAQQAVAEYDKDADVEYAELNYIVSIVSTEPDDPCYPVQWALANTGQTYPESGYYRDPPGTPDCDIDANEAWDLHTGSSDVIVAVIDTGVDYTHRDLSANMWTNSQGLHGYDYINDDNDPMDDHGHGTHCAGIIAADTNNGLDIAGVSWNAKIMALKFLAWSGSGDTSDAVLAFCFATDNGADITSNSWGGGGYSQALKETIDYAHSQGVITVAAAGNNDSNNPNRYPANYDHVISVAATDSNDDKASFSNYGEWVDIAAPGVDILSLRAKKTSMGSVQDDYTTVASGTSMACPHVAGACALLLSVNPYMSPDDANDILTDANSVDPIADGICGSDGRLNAYKSLVATVPSKGYISLDKTYYNCDCNVGISLADCDIKGLGPIDVNITASGGDWETVALTETGTNSGIFTGIVPTSNEPNDPNDPNDDGVLQVSDGETVTVTYQDANDGTGSPASPNDTATVDCVDPNIISDVNVTVVGPIVTVTFQTDVNVLGRVLYGTECNQTNNSDNVDWGTNHSIKLLGVSPWTDHYFKVTATDFAGNQVVDDNDGSCYQFSTDGPNDFDVPGDYNTIQEAIDNSWDGGTVTVAEGTYYESAYPGVAWVAISFKGRAITVKSADPNDWDVVANTIIDANGAHNGGVYLGGDEDANSVLRGFTVRNAKESGVSCSGTHPVIEKCILEKNGARGIYIGGKPSHFASPTIRNNIIRKNGLTGILSTDCSEPIIENNLIYGNDRGIWGSGESDVRNNTIAFNVKYGVVKGSGAADVNIANCILWGNTDDVGNGYSATYSCIEDGDSGQGNISSDPCFINSFDFIDVTDANGTTTTIIVADANLYEVNDVIEYDDDGVARTVTGVDTDSNTVTFSNDPLDANSVSGIRIYNWGIGATDVNEDFHLSVSPNSPCIDAGDPAGGDYYGQTDIDGDARVMTLQVDMGADEAAYFPPSHPDYNEWANVSEPNCWCWRRQCRGDADNVMEGTAEGGYYYIGDADLQLLLDNWQVLEPPKGSGIVYLGEPNMCADFDHAEAGNPKQGYFRVGGGDLNILAAYWQIKEPPKGSGVDPNCFE